MWLRVFKWLYVCRSLLSVCLVCFLLFTLSSFKKKIADFKQRSEGWMNFTLLLQLPSGDITDNKEFRC